MTIWLLKRKLRHTSKPNSPKISSSQEQKHRAPWLMERILWANRVHQICNVMWLKLESTLFQISSLYALSKKWLLSFQLQASLPTLLSFLQHPTSPLYSLYLEHLLEKSKNVSPITPSTIKPGVEKELLFERAAYMLFPPRYRCPSHTAHRAKRMLESEVKKGKRNHSISCSKKADRLGT